MLFYRFPPNLIYYFYKKKWNKILNNKSLGFINWPAFFKIENNIISFDEKKSWNVYKFNLLWKYNRKNFPTNITNDYIKKIMFYIDKMNLTLTVNEQLVIDSWNTYNLLVYRAIKNIVIPFNKISRSEFCYFKIENCKVYQMKINKIYDLIIDDFKNYHLCSFGTVYITSQRLVILNRSDNNFSLPVFSIFNYKEIDRITISKQYVLIKTTKKTFYIITFAEKNTILFSKYIDITQEKANSESIINRIVVKKIN